MITLTAEQAASIATLVIRHPGRAIQISAESTAPEGIVLSPVRVAYSHIDPYQIDVDGTIAVVEGS